MQRRFSIFTGIHILNTGLIVLALAAPSWLPISWGHIRTCLIILIIWEAAIIASFIGCLINCSTSNPSEGEQKCVGWCEYWHSVLAGFGTTLFFLCIVLSLI